MTRDTGGPPFGSRLPDDPEYWRRLSDRIVESAAPALSELRTGRPAWWSGLATSAPWLATAAAAAVAAVLLLPGSPREPASPNVYALVPTDPVAALVLADAPPTIEALLGLTPQQEVP